MVYESAALPFWLGRGNAMAQMMEIIERIELELIEYPDGTGRIDWYRIDETGRTLVPEKCETLDADDVAFFKRVCPDERN